jgi:hypothetical protein
LFTRGRFLGHNPEVLALEIAEELEAALEQFAAIAEDLKR